MQMSDDVQVRWWSLEASLVERFGKKPDLETILYLIGLQETNLAASKYSKEQKQDLMHVGVCTVLKPSGYYLFTHKDEEGWPHFTQVKPLPELPAHEQEWFLKDHVLLYFQNQTN